ncbi:MAG: succinylglutamate desuccinylase/aspartoacylase family protein [Alphaproteobacteria bacterium]|nr:succinylglutamate desuccinylase/aspartoacylase family protein [Alphaproteobacteria bacterium]
MTLLRPPELRFPVEITPPDIAPWRAGNSGVPYFWSYAGPEPGPHVLLVSLMHGNELCGAITIDTLLRAGVRPLRGRLTMGFANVDAFSRFDPSEPTTSRFVDEDMNRIWSAAELEGDRQSTELARARAMRPLVDRADIVLDLHSMLWESVPLILCGPQPRTEALALSLGAPALVVVDQGHANGPRLIDYARFVAADGTATGLLVESGQHWRRETPAVSLAAALSLLLGQGMIAPEAARALQPAAPAFTRPRLARVTRTITAKTSSFAFVREVHGGDMIERRNTLIALDGDAEVRTPHDHCLLVMPSLRTSKGHTAVRLARFIARG